MSLRARALKRGCCWLVPAAALTVGAFFGVVAPSPAITQADIDGLARDAAVQLAFATRLQGRWACSGNARDGAVLKATMLLFTVKPGAYEFELTPQPASSTFPNVIETWEWRWSYAKQGQWFASADPRTAGACIQYTSDGWSGMRLLWIQHLAQSTVSRTFDRPPAGSLAYTLHDGVVSDPAKVVYRLSCRRSPAAR